MNKQSVIIFEDNKHFRESLQLLVSSSKDFECAGAYANTMNCVSIVEKINPAVVLMDIEMPLMNGIDATKMIKQKFPEIPIIILTTFNDSERIFQSLSAGGNGYLLKNSAPEEILKAIKEVFNGGSMLSPSIAKKVVEFFRKETPVQQNNYNLTAKETELLYHLTEGKSYKMIADAMQVSLETVKSHIKNVFRKLHVSSSSEAVAKAIKQKIV